MFERIKAFFKENKYWLWFTRHIAWLGVAAVVFYIFGSKFNFLDLVLVGCGLTALMYGSGNFGIFVYTKFKHTEMSEQVKSGILIAAAIVWGLTGLAYFLGIFGKEIAEALLKFVEQAKP